MEGGSLMLFYHRTSTARKILREGFRSVTWQVGDQTFRGIWISNRPLKTNDDEKGDELLEIILDPEQCQLDRFELGDKGKFYREWCVPASILNTYSRRRLVPWHETTESRH